MPITSDTRPPFMSAIDVGSSPFVTNPTPLYFEGSDCGLSRRLNTVYTHLMFGCAVTAFWKDCSPSDGSTFCVGAAATWTPGYFFFTSASKPAARLRDHVAFAGPAMITPGPAFFPSFLTS